jgi:hypothetical protein
MIAGLPDTTTMRAFPYTLSGKALFLSRCLCSQEKGELKMKRVLLICVVAVLVVSCNILLGAAAQDGGVTVLEAEVQPAITMSIGSAGTLTLDPAYGGTSSTSQTINVKSNQGYTLLMRADRSSLTKFNGTYDQTVCLQSPLEWKVLSEDMYVSIGEINTPITQSSTATGADGDDITVEFRQSVGFGDAVLSDGTYRIEITYTALQ